MFELLFSLLWIPDLIVAQYTPIEYTWSRPTTREDDSALALTDIRHYDLTYSCDTGRQGHWIVSRNSTSYTPENALLGRCDVTITTVDTHNQSSKPSRPFKIFVKLNQPQRGGFR